MRKQEPIVQYQLLIVDDDRVLSPLIEEYLQARGYNTKLCHDGLEGLCAFKNDNFDLCIFDVRMPIKNGFELASEIHEIAPETPFLFLTHESDKDKRIEGLKLGADDYVLKPFSMEELYLRIKRILKRVSQKPNNEPVPVNREIKVGRYTFLPESRELLLEEERIDLSAIEAQLLLMFCESPSGFIDRETALKRIWNDTYMTRSRSLNVYVSKLRKYLSGDDDIKVLNVHGSGYKLSISSPTQEEGYS